jgi:CspA family cold shock protein
MNGTIKWYNDTKGYGFVQGEDGKDYFVHSSAIQGGARLRDNDAVTFDPAQGDRGPKAENVKTK